MHYLPLTIEDAIEKTAASKKTPVLLGENWIGHVALRHANGLTSNLYRTPQAAALDVLRYEVSVASRPSCLSSLDAISAG